MTGIIGAMESEVKLLLENVRDKKQTVYAGTVFCSGKLYGNDVVIAKCGIGKVSAAICAEIMIDIYRANRIINTGVAGGLHPDLEVGDFVIADNLVQYDFDLSATGCAKGYIPCEELLVRNPDKSTPTKFVADRRLVEQLQRAAKSVGAPNAYVGTIASADIFVSDNELKARIIRDFSAYAVEMEGAAIAQVASLSRVPFAVIRAISDLADKEATVSFDEFEESAAALSAKIVMEMLRMS